jgi:ABC-2 type transport system permease protein
MNTRASSLPFEPVAPNAWHAFAGVWRLTFRGWLAPARWLMLGGLLVALAVPSIAVLRDANPGFFTQWAAGFYLTFLVPVFAFLSGGSAMREEMKPEAVDFLFTRPMRRSAFVVFKFASHLACVQMSFLLALVVLIAIGLFRQVPIALPSLPWLLLGQVFAVTAFEAFGFLCAVLTGRYLIIGLLYAGIVEVAVGHVPTQLNRIAMTHQVKSLLYPMLVQTTPGLKADQTIAASVAVLLVFSAVSVGLAAVIFAQRELAGARPSDA